MDGDPTGAAGPDRPDRPGWPLHISEFQGQVRFSLITTLHSSNYKRDDDRRRASEKEENGQLLLEVSPNQAEM